MTHVTRRNAFKLIHGAHGAGAITDHFVNKDAETVDLVRR